MGIILTLGVSNFVFAAGTNKITVTHTVKGETYNVYKMMDLEVDDPAAPTAYKYTIASGWDDFFTAGFGKAYVTIDTSDGHVSWKDGMDADDKMILLAQEAEKVASNPAGTQEATDDTVIFSGLENGYYLITSTLGTKAMIDSTPTTPEQTITEKNPEDTIEKEVQENSDSSWGKSNDAKVGDTVIFRSTASIQPYTRNVFIHDTMDAGLDYQNDVAIQGLTAGTDYVVLAPPQTGDTFTIQITDNYIEGLSDAATLTLTYSAKLTTAAVSNDPAIVDQKNKTKITYGDKQSVEDETITTTHKFSVFKHEKNKTTNLAGAVFELHESTDGSGEALKLTKINDTNYRVDPAGTITTFTTVASGDIVIWGVDSGNKYSLVETQAPAGYNKLSDPVAVTVDAGNATIIDVENNKGTELPSTGGSGTTMIYIIGVILLAGAGILLVTRRRMKAE